MADAVVHPPAGVRAPTHPLAGALLLASGSWLLARQLLGVGIASLALLVGAVLIAGWLHSRRPMLLGVGAPLSGAAAGLLLAGVLPAALGMTSLLAGTAAGYAAAAIVHRWAALPAVMAGALALAASGVDVARVLSPSAAGVLLSAAALAVGAALVLRPAVPRAAAVACTAVVLLASTTALAVTVQAAVPGALSGAAVPTVRTTQAIILPELDGRSLVVVASSATTVLRDGPLGGEAMVEGPAGLGGAVTTAVEVVERDDRVEIRQLPLAGATTLTLTLPPAVRTSILGGTGDVIADLRGPALEIDTTSGTVSATLAIGEADEVIVRSDSGDVDVHVSGMPRLTAEAADLFIDGFGVPVTQLQRFSTPAGVGSLTVTSRSGVVAVVGVPAAGTALSRASTHAARDASVTVPTSP